MWNMQSTQTGLHFCCVIFRYLWKNSPLMTHPIFILFQCFSCGYKKITGCYHLLKQQLFFTYFPPFLSDLFMPSIYIFILPNPSHHSSTSLLLQLLVGATTPGPLVSSFPLGGQATTKTPWVVSGSLRPSREAPSRSALTGLYDSASTTHPWKQRCTHILYINTKTDKNWDSTQSLMYVYRIHILYCMWVLLYLTKHRPMNWNVHKHRRCTPSPGSLRVKDIKSEEVERSPGPIFQKCWKPRVILYFAYWLPLTSLESCSKRKKQSCCKIFISYH